MHEQQQKTNSDFNKSQVDRLRQHCNICLAYLNRSPIEHFSSPVIHRRFFCLLVCLTVCQSIRLLTFHIFAFSRNTGSNSTKHDTKLSFVYKTNNFKLCILLVTRHFYFHFFLRSIKSVHIYHCRHNKWRNKI